MFFADAIFFVSLQMQTERNPFAERKRISALSLDVNFDTSLKVMQRIV